jgi:hypothetical protein
MSTSLSATIMEFLNNIFGNADERAEFLADPEAYFEAHDLDDLSCADFDDALVSFFDNSRGDYNLGGNFENTVAGPGESDHEAIAKHLTEIVHNYGDTYITNNDNDVVNDNSVGQIIADGDVTLDNDITSASGDGAVAAGDDINGPTNTGDIEATDSGVNFGAGSTVRGGDDQDNDTTTTTTNTTTNTTVQDNSQDNDGNVGGNVTSTETDVDIDVELEDSLNDNSDQSQDNDTTNTNTNDDGFQAVV